MAKQNEKDLEFYKKNKEALKNQKSAESEAQKSKKVKINRIKAKVRKIETKIRKIFNLKKKFKTRIQRVFRRTNIAGYDTRQGRFLENLYGKETFYKEVNKQISIKITHNNIFCTISKLVKQHFDANPLKKNLKLKREKRTLFVCSAGKYKLHISKKLLKFNSKLFIEKFLESTKNYIESNEGILIFLSGPIRIRKFILKKLNTHFRKTKVILIKINSLKCFNGCKVKKQRRKKHKKFIVFK